LTSAGNQKLVTDPRGTVTSIIYDVLNRMTSVTEAVGDNAVQRTTSFEYDAANNLMREWRPTGTLGYDSQPSPYRVSTEYAYDPQNQLLSKTDAASSAADHRTTSYLYDAQAI